MQTETRHLITAIEVIKPELPAMLGDAWPSFRRRMGRMLYALKEEPEAETEIRAAIMELFAEQPAADAMVRDAIAVEAARPIFRGGFSDSERLARLLEGGDWRPDIAMAEPPTFEGIIAAPETSGAEPGDRVVGPPDELFESVPPPRDEPGGGGDDPDARGEAARVIRFTDISCPRRVFVGAQRFTATVRLTQQVRAASVDVRPLSVIAGRPVRVRLDAPGFELLDGIAADQEITVPPSGDSSYAIFELRPRAVGQFTLRFDFAQDGQPVGSASAMVEVTAMEVSESDHEPRFAPAPDFSLSPDTPPPDRVLTVGYDEEEKRLRFILDSADGTTRRFEQKLTQSPAATMEERYRRLTALANRQDPQTKVFLNRESAIDAEEIDEEWATIGRTLWNDLIPAPLKALYAEQRAAWRDSTLLILSFEPTIPWEMLWPYGAGWQDDEPWCLSMALTRWLHSDAQAQGNPHGPRDRIALSRYGLLAPTYAALKNLPYAHIEADELGALFDGCAAARLGPEGGTRSAVRAFLREKPYTLLHIAAHGKFAADEPGVPSTAILTGNRDLVGVSDGTWPRSALGADLPLGPDSFNDPQIEALMAENHPTFFLNACEVGRLAWGLTGAEGWAATLVTKGATAFIGPLWLANDASARAFSLAFYRALLDGATLGNAARAARRAARRAGDPTWLAYSVYGHPNAVVG